MLVGIDHGFSFPRQYFEVHGLKPDWPSFLDDFQRHWPTDEDIYVDFVLDGREGNGAARSGDPRWRRLTEKLAGGAKSVFQFHVRARWQNRRMPEFPGYGSSANSSASASTSGRSTVGRFLPAAPPSLKSIPGCGPGASPAKDRTADQHDAYSAARWLSRADHDGTLAGFLKPSLTPSDRATAEVEGWMLGVAG